MDQRLHIVPQKCTGCRQCELACSWVQTGSFQPARSLMRVYVFDEEASYAPHSCLQCDEAWCMNVCPVNAIGIDESTGAKRVDSDLCVGCHLCVLVCPFGTAFTQPETGKAAKCDLCGGRPACAAVCPTEAIEFAKKPMAGAWFENWSQQVQAGRAAIWDAPVES